jgi:hypothetical protein
MRKILLLLNLLVFSATAAMISATLWPQPGVAQQMRFLPANGKRGVTGNSLSLPQVVIGRETRLLAPGGVIFDTYNRTILHGSLPVGADVWYQLDSNDQIQRIYVLRREEQARLDSEKK